MTNAQPLIQALEQEQSTQHLSDRAMAQRLNLRHGHWHDIRHGHKPVGYALVTGAAAAFPELSDTILRQLTHDATRRTGLPHP